ncbi:MAG: adenosine kinase [Bacteroidales bacterium]|nr:adenosine kinase [Bacteroidales bacterium]
MNKKVLGIGNALIDLLIPLKDEAIFTEFNLAKGASNLVNRETYVQILNKVQNQIVKKVSGGSAANTIHGISGLGLSTGFIGKVGNDAFGAFLKQEMEEHHITPHLLNSTTETGAAITFITPDSERTFAVFLGAAVELEAEDLKAEFFQGYDYFHIEGYMVQNHPMMLRALQLAKEAGLHISLDLASYTMVESNLVFLKEIIDQYVDIVFANEEESKSFTGKEPEQALEEIAQKCQIAIVKVGKAGSWVKTAEKVIFVEPIFAQPIDTTGAGDLYASGLLFGLATDLSIEKSGKIASLLAGTVIQQMGAKIPEASWKEIRKQL